MARRRRTTMKALWQYARYALSALTTVAFGLSPN
jgi:hypothetical protein